MGYCFKKNSKNEPEVHLKMILNQATNSRYTSQNKLEHKNVINSNQTRPDARMYKVSHALIAFL